MAEPDSHYAKLIDLCDVHKLHVGLSVSKATGRTPRGELCRDLDCVTVRIGAGAVLRERVDADLEVCAARLLRRLQSIPRYAGS